MRYACNVSVKPSTPDLLVKLIFNNYMGVKLDPTTLQRRFL